MRATGAIGNVMSATKITGILVPCPGERYLQRRIGPGIKLGIRTPNPLADLDRSSSTRVASHAGRAGTTAGECVPLAEVDGLFEKGVFVGAPFPHPVIVNRTTVATAIL